MTIDDNDRLMAGDLDDPFAGTVQVEVPSTDPILVAVGAHWFLREPGARWCQIQKDTAAIEIARIYPKLRVMRETESGAMKPLPATAIYDRYGRRADQMIYRMGAQGKYIERGSGLGGELVIGCCQMLPIEPVFHQVVDDWLALIGGHGALRLLDWLACAHRLDRPIAALYLRGDPSCGKSMLASAISGMWGKHRTSYADVVLGNYTGALLKCPIVHLDERAPEDKDGRASGAFRELIGNSVRPLTEKYMPAGTIEGCPRLVITSNDDDALRLTPEDQRRADDAIGLRILHLVASPETSGYIEALGGRNGTDEWVNRADGSPGIIAEHIRWLQVNWTVTRPGSRLLIEGDPASWTQSVAARRGLPQRILVTVAKVLARVVEPAMSEADPCWIHYQGGGSPVIAVSVEALRASWIRLSGEDARPSEQAIGQALARIGPRARLQRGGVRPWAYTISPALLIEAVQNTGVVELDQLPPELLAKPTA